MPWRAIPTVRRDVDVRSDRLAKALETHCREGDRAWDVARESAQRRRLSHVRLNELPQLEARRQLQLHRGGPGRDLIEVARQLALVARVVEDDAPGQQRVAHRLLETESVDDAQRKAIRLTHRR